MTEVIVLQDRQLDRSFDAVQDIRVTPDAHEGVILAMRAFGTFAPSAFDGMRIRIDLDGPNGPAAVCATIRSRPAEEPRGTWYPYDVEFDSPMGAEQIVFRGMNFRSNVRRVAFLGDGRAAHTAHNPWFQAWRDLHV